MPRPFKEASEKRDTRLTIYFTATEAEQLTAVADHLRQDKTKFVVGAVKAEIDRLTNPPELVQKARHEAILQSKGETVQGYICGKGHAVWIDEDWPSAPDYCPCCGDKNIKRIWAGTVKPGF